MPSLELLLQHKTVGLVAMALSHACWALAVILGAIELRRQTELNAQLHEQLGRTLVELKVARNTLAYLRRRSPPIALADIQLAPETESTPVTSSRRRPHAHP